MMTILNSTRNVSLARNASKAVSPLTRLKGLIGRRQMSPDEALWIPACNSIHTFFMSFDIDVVFTDRNFKVLSIHRRVQPWRLLMPKWSAYHTFEFAGGCLNENNLKLGDSIHVGH